MWNSVNFGHWPLQVGSPHWLIIVLTLWPTLMDHVQTLIVHERQTECWVKCEEVAPGAICYLNAHRAAVKKNNLRHNMVLKFL